MPRVLDRKVINSLTQIAEPLDVKTEPTTAGEGVDDDDLHEFLSGLAEKYNLGWKWDEDDKEDEEGMVKSFMDSASMSNRKDLMDAVNFKLKL